MARHVEDRDRFIKFYPSDWRGDEELRLCSLAARGLWMELLCLAHKHGGYVLIGKTGSGIVPSLAEIARQASCSTGEATRLIAELIRLGVASRRDDEALYSRRLVRDARKREINQANGSRGGNPTLLDNRSNGSSVDELVNRNDKPQRPEARDHSQKPDQKKNTRAPRSAFADGFSEFWQAYPLKVAKAAAQKAWSKLQPDAALQAVIVAAVNAQRDDLTFVKDGQLKGTYPASWLNGKRWEDEAKSLSILQRHGKEKLLQVARSDPWGMVAECLRHHEGGCTGNDDHNARMQREQAVNT